jgi:putative oxidoreductase
MWKAWRIAPLGQKRRWLQQPRNPSRFWLTSTKTTNNDKKETKGKTIVKIATIIARSLLGLIFVVFGSNMFLHFIPMPPPPEGPARDFMIALFVSHYLYVIGALQVAGGVLVLIGRWVPLGLTLLGPVIVNILCFHVLMAPAGLPMAVVVSVLALFLLWRYRASFVGICAVKIEQRQSTLTVPS